VLAAASGGCAVSETGSPGIVSDGGATVAGRVLSTVGGEVEYWVQYGPTTAYGAETAHATTTTEQNVGRSVTVQIGGLERATTYHYRLCASDTAQTGGPGCGADRTVTTQSFACGETVTTSVRLTGDAFCESSVAVLVVGADGIDVNLVGHELGTPSGSGGGSDAFINPGHDDVTLRNGSVVGRVRLEDASRNLIRDIEAGGGSDVVIVEGGQANQVRASTIFGRGAGIAANGTDGLVIAGNTVTGGLGPGIRVVGDAARIVRNQLPLEGSAGFVSGIELTGAGHRVVDNVLTGPWRAGSIALLAGADNVIAENQVSGASDDFTPSGDRFGDGIFVGTFTTGTLLRDNVANANDGDGIEVVSPSARLRDNTANFNGDFGIDAAAGVTDLGGNSASGNGNPLQCSNVFCQ
jgi:hypothetical protein